MSNDPGNFSILYLLLCGLLCFVSLGVGGIGLFIWQMRRTQQRMWAPVHTVTHALVRRLSTPHPVIHQTVYKAAESEAVALKRWQTIQIWTAILSVVAIVIGAVLLGAADVAVVLVAALANTIVVGLKWVVTQRFGGTDDTLTKR